MKIVLNGEAREVAGPTLADVLVETGYGGAKVATAVNEDFVPAGLRGTTAVAAGDRIEVVTPRQGG